jgi:hypothetical protein
MRSISLLFKFVGLAGLVVLCARTQAQNQINPNTQIRWPITCNSGVYSPASNTCVPVGTAGNPAGLRFQLQYNGGGVFAGSSGLQVDGSGIRLIGKLPRIDITHSDFGTPVCPNVADPSYALDSTCAIQADIAYAVTTCRSVQGQTSCNPVYIPQGHYKQSASITVPANITVLFDGVVSKTFNGDQFVVSGNNVSLLGNGAGAIDGGGQIGTVNISHVAGTGTTATYNYTTTGGLLPAPGMMIFITGCTTDSSLGPRGFNGYYTVSTATSSQFTLPNSTNVTENETTCTGQLYWSGNGVRAIGVSNTNINGMQVTNQGGTNAVSFENATNAAIRNSYVSGNQQGINVTGNSSYIAVQNNIIDTHQSFLFAHPLKFDNTGSNTITNFSVIGNIAYVGAGFCMEGGNGGLMFQNGIIANNVCNQTPITFKHTDGTYSFGGFSLNGLNYTVSGNQVRNLTGQPANLPGLEIGGNNVKIQGNSLLSEPAAFYVSDSDISGNTVLLAPLGLTNGGSAGVQFISRDRVHDNVVNLYGVSPGHVWAATLNTPLGYIILDTNNNLQQVISNVPLQATGSTQPCVSTAPTCTVNYWGTTPASLTVDGGVTWQNLGPIPVVAALVGLKYQCNSATMTCTDTSFYNNTVVDNFRSTGQAFQGGGSGVINNLQVRNNKFIGFNTCYSIATTATNVSVQLNDDTCTNPVNLPTNVQYISNIAYNNAMHNVNWNLVTDSGFKAPGLWTTTGYTRVAAAGLQGTNALQFTGTGSPSGFIKARSPVLTLPTAGTFTLSAGIGESVTPVFGSPNWVVQDPTLTTTYASAGLTNSCNDGITGHVCATFTLPAGVSQVVLVANTNNSSYPAGTNIWWSIPQIEQGTSATNYKENLLGGLNTILPPASLGTGTMDSSHYLNGLGQWALTPAFPVFGTAKKTSGTCTTAATSFAACTDTLTWTWTGTTPSTLSTVQCGGIGPNDPRASGEVLSYTTSQVIYQTVSEGSVAVNFSEIDCFAKQ